MLFEEKDQVTNVRLVEKPLVQIDIWKHIGMQVHITKLCISFSTICALVRPCEFFEECVKFPLEERFCHKIHIFVIYGLNLNMCVLM